MIRFAARRFLRSRSGVAGAAATAAMLVFIVLVPTLRASDPDAVDFTIRNEGPSLGHPLGTDFFGRDLLVRVALGGRYSLAIAGAALAIVLVAGFLYGATAAMLPRRLDALLMRIVDSLLAVPRFPTIVIVLTIAGDSTNAATVVLALSIGGWLIPARLVRHELVSLQQRPFVTAARAVGVGPLRLVRRHFLPNALGVLLVAAFLEVPTLVLSEAFASALGLGINPPTPTWGNIALDGMDERRVWQVFVASVAITGFSIAANFVADGLQDALEPRRGTTGSGMRASFRTVARMLVGRARDGAVAER